MKYSFRKGFLEATRYLNETRMYIFFIFGLFLFCTFVAFALPGEFTFFDKLLKDIVSQIGDAKGIKLVWLIFKNNVSSAFLGMVFGIVFGVFPLVNAITNGALIGYVMSRAYDLIGGSVILRLMPHGVFELPAIFISLGLGLRLGLTAFTYSKTKEGRKKGFWNSLGYNLRQSVKIFFLFVLPLLVIAAIIEGTLITLFSP